MTPGDRRLLEAMTARALVLYRQHGAVQPFGAVETDSGVAIYATNGLPDIESKRSLMNAMRLASFDMPGNRSALCFEGWAVVADTPESRSIMERLRSEGRSISEHPDVIDALHVMVESEDGSTTRTVAIARCTEGITLMPPTDEYQPGPSRNTGDLTGYHVTTGMRRDREFCAYIDMVRFVIEREHEGQLAN